MSSYSDYAEAVGRIEQNRGNAAAQAAQNRGAIWGNTIANIGQIVGSIPQQRAELEKVKLAAEEMQLRRDRAATEAAQAKSEAEKEQQLSALWNAPDPPTPSAILRIDSGARGRDMVKLLESFQAHPQTPIEQQENIGKMLKYFPALPEQDKAAAWTTLRPVLVSVSGDQSVPEQYDPNWVTMRVGAAPPTVAKTRTVTVTNADGSKTEKIVEDTPGQSFDSAAPTTHPTGAGNINEIELARLAASGDPEAQKAWKLYQAAQGSRKATGEGGPVRAPGAANVPDVAPGEKNETYLKSLPTEQAALVKALAEGRKSFPTGAALRSDYWQGVLGAVAKYDPSFDEVNYNARSKTRAAFTSGSEAKNINALNTVIGHLDRLSDAADALHNGNVRAFNAAANWLSKSMGRPTVTNFDVVKKAVSDEVTRVWRQAGGSVEDIRSAMENLNNAGSPAQLHGAIAEYGHLLESKLASLQDQYKQGMGTDDIGIIRQDSRAVLTKLEQRASGQAVATAPKKPNPFREEQK